MVQYAAELRKQHRASMTQLRSSKKKKHQRQRHFCRGLNVQAQCRQKFGAPFGNIKICQLEKQAKQQRWHLLTEAQQRASRQLTDQQKMNVGLDSVKGWKSLRDDPSRFSDKLKTHIVMPRWDVPGRVLEERDDNRKRA